MNLFEIIKENCIIFLEGRFSKETLLEKFTNVFYKTGGISDKYSTLSSLVDRERLGSTGLGDEIAIPHAKIASISDVKIVVGISKNGINYASSDGLPVKIFFVVLAPESDISAHLKTLSRISKLIKLTDFKRKVLETQNSLDVLSILKTEESKLE